MAFWTHFCSGEGLRFGTRTDTSDEATGIDNPSVVLFLDEEHGSLCMASSKGSRRVERATVSLNDFLVSPEREPLTKYVDGRIRASDGRIRPSPSPARLGRGRLTSPRALF